MSETSQSLGARRMRAAPDSIFAVSIQREGETCRDRFSEMTPASEVCQNWQLPPLPHAFGDG